MGVPHWTAFSEAFLRRPLIRRRGRFGTAFGRGWRPGGVLVGHSILPRLCVAHEDWVIEGRRLRAPTTAPAGRRSSARTAPVSDNHTSGPTRFQGSSRPRHVRCGDFTKHASRGRVPGDVGVRERGRPARSGPEGLGRSARERKCGRDARVPRSVYDEACLVKSPQRTCLWFVADGRRIPEAARTSANPSGDRGAELREPARTQLRDQSGPSRLRQGAPRGEPALRARPPIGTPMIDTVFEDRTEPPGTPGG